MTSISTQIKKLHALLGTRDLSDWESQFVQSVWDQTGEGADTTFLSAKQAEKIGDLHGRHFGG